MNQENKPIENEITEIQRMEDKYLRRWEITQEILVFAVTVIVVAMACFLYGRELTELAGITIMAGAGAGAVIYTIEKCRRTNHFLYDNESNLWRFTLCYLLFLSATVLFPMLPIGGWPFLAIFIALMLFSSELIGLVAGSNLLLLAILLHTNGSAADFGIYFVAGLIGILLFSTVNESFQIWQPMLISLLLQFVCLCIREVLYVNDVLNWSMFFIPAINVLVCLILLLIILKIFSFSFIYKTRDIYMDINDPECELLVELKNVSREEYYHTIHTAYLCSRIAMKLGLDDAVVKACGYYHRIGMLKNDNSWNNVEQILRENNIPDLVCNLLKEYLSPKEQVKSKEVVVLLFADTVISSINYLFSKDKNVELDYQKLIYAIFKKKIESGIIDYSDISLGEIQKMKEILVEERLYYDFLR